ncbi:WGxxGxxG family protein [Nostoc sp.]|uniref:WGxxGxxG family protein n=1 Tax=Nostoc sp. TaxID=1180 RepID=UPI003FA59009
MTTSQRTSDRGFNWGWLGLLGLAGLAGLARNRDQVRAYRDPNEVTGSRSK